MMHINDDETHAKCGRISREHRNRLKLYNSLENSMRNRRQNSLILIMYYVARDVVYIFHLF